MCVSLHDGVALDGRGFPRRRCVLRAFAAGYRARNINWKVDCVTLCHVFSPRRIVSDTAHQVKPPGTLADALLEHTHIHNRGRNDRWMVYIYTYGKRDWQSAHGSCWPICLSRRSPLPSGSHFYSFRFNFHSYFFLARLDTHYFLLVFPKELICVPTLFVSPLQLKKRGNFLAVYFEPVSFSTVFF